MDTHKKDLLLKNGYLTDDPIYAAHAHNLDVEANHIYLLGSDLYAGTEMEDPEPGVEYVMANSFIKNINILMRRSDKPILIHMKTCGGIYEEGMAIHDAIMTCPNPVTILSYTHARSMSSLIFQAADKRVMMPNSTFMFHQGSMGYEGTARQFLTQAEELKKSDETMLEIYINSMKQKGKFKNRSKKFIRDFLQERMRQKEDVFLTAKETVEYGLADEVFGQDGIYDWKSLTEYED